MKLLCLHAHFDDFEFTAAGTFEMWRRRLGSSLRAKVIVCTDGRAGHHFRSCEETTRLRRQEQEASARIGNYEFELLRLRDGQTPREAGLIPDRDLLAALWKAIRDFEPDYLFCPPIPADPLAGVHVDHIAVAEAVRKVAYLINVPHAFLSEYPADETRSIPCKVPVILNVYDGYMSGANRFDLAVDVESAFDSVAAMTYCHQSQIMEWIPWVGRHQMPQPASLEDWTRILRERMQREKAELGISETRAVEMFTVTAWGVIPSPEQIRADFPLLIEDSSRSEALTIKLLRWRKTP